MQLIGDIARKTGEPGLLRVEAEKSRLALSIGERSGAFRVPRVLELDATRGALDFERIPALSTLTDAIARRRIDPRVAGSRLGRALALIHLELELPHDMRIPLPEEWSHAAGRQVCLHGDFTASNVCIDARDDALVIVDWSCAPFVGRTPTTGPGCFDVAWFVRHFMMGATTATAIRWPGPELCDEFILSYVDGVQEPIDRALWSRHTNALDPFARICARQRSERATLWTRPIKTLVQNGLYRRWRAYAPPPGALSPIQSTSMTGAACT